MPARTLRKSAPRLRKAASAPAPARPAAPDSEGARAHLEIRIWLRLLTCANRIETVLQRKIAAAFGISLARFDLLAQLEPHPTDRRTILVRLTEEGRRRFLEMAREHESWLAALLNGLEKESKEQLLASLGALKRQLDGVEAAT